MKNLYKKLSVVVLSGALLIGGPLSSGLMAYADSDKDSSKADVGYDEDAVDKNEMRIGQYQYGYEILASDSIKNGNLESHVKSFPWIKKIEEKFLGGMFFRWYLYNEGIKKGEYLVKVGELVYLLYFPNDVPAGIPWWNYNKVPGGYYGDSK